jgi:nitroreductase
MIFREIRLLNAVPNDDKEMKAMSVMDVIQSRVSIRKYDSRPVEPEKLDLILEAGRLAPSANNRQSWKFVLVMEQLSKEKLSDACTNKDFILQAPATLVICTDENRLMSCRQPAGTVNCCIALSFMMLQASELGLGTCWLGAFDADKAKSALDLPAELTVVAITPVGYGTENPSRRSRKSIAEILIRK